MDSWTKENLVKLLITDANNYHERAQEAVRLSKEAAGETRRYFEMLLTQISSTGTGPLISKTPKVPKRMRPPRIKTIPEQNELEDETLSETMSSRSSRVDLTTEASFAHPGRLKRGASMKATENMKRQQSVKLTTKLRRPSSMDEDERVSAKKETRSKRPKESLGSSDEEDVKRPSKLSKVNTPEKAAKNEMQNDTRIIEESPEITNKKMTRSSANQQQQRSAKRKYEESVSDNKTLTRTCNTPYKEQGNVLCSSIDEPTPKRANTSKKLPQSLITSELVVKLEATNIVSSSQSGRKSPYPINDITKTSKKADVTNQNESIECSLYEDAINKPIMNSTLINPNSTVTLEKLWNATVVIEPIQSAINNETITYNKKSSGSTSRKNSANKVVTEKAGNQRSARSTMKKNSFDSPMTPLPKSTAKKISKTTLNSLKQVMKNEKFDELITDDESSPERKGAKKSELKKPLLKKRVTRSSIVSDDDEVVCTPVKKPLGEGSVLKSGVLKNAYKQIALFSPYTKDSVKKRVEAFELAGSSPKQIETSAPISRVTRGKTRALASTAAEPTATQKVARKSLAKAIKISLAKHIREFDETKENDLGSVENSVKKSKFLSVEKSAQKLKSTPLGKSRLQPPSSVNRNQQTPSNGQTLTSYSKPLTASRGNIVSHVDSFIQTAKSTTKHNSSQDKQLEERRRRAYEEDARRKREEALKAQTDEKRRKREEKELKNKLAREAKERLEMEKRLKAEKEKEEKAKLALQMQEKQREEMERKKLAQLQRAQEKEEKRRQEEQLRLQRLHEQEEAERQLAEQKRREQEAEKRKHQLLTSKAKPLNKQGPISYKIDSEPDEEESDDESSPKHQIPNWASKHVRQGMLAMQQHVPMMTILKFFDAKKCTPDLSELFTGIDPKRLKRTSSAIWKAPPRFSMMEDL